MQANFIVSNVILMKTIPFLALLAVLTLTSSYVSAVMATPPPAEIGIQKSFNHFRVHRQGAAVALSWSVSDISVSHFLVERSYDGVSFSPIWEMPSGGSMTHKYMDEDIYGGTYYYRITAVTAAEGTLQSDVEQVRIVRRK